MLIYEGLLNIGYTMGGYMCCCGCGRFIEIKPHHKYTGIPKYIFGHARHRTPKSKEARENTSKARIGKPRPKSFIAALSGPNNPNYNHEGRSVDQFGYILLRVNGKWRYEHVLIAERILGRPLNKGEVVHHIDLNKGNNKNNNLLICSREYHIVLHNRYAQRFAELHLVNA